jgi:hypothetical protein
MTNLILLLIPALTVSICRGTIPDEPGDYTIGSGFQEIPADKQILLNGRIWRNQYLKVEGDQFFVTNTFIKGSVTFNGKKYSNLNVKFDILNDELILNVESNPIIFLNKEMVDSFTLNIDNRSYNVINAGNDTSSVLRGYVNVLYDGPSSLFVKYSKYIQPLAVDGKYDLFYQQHRIYLKWGSEIVQIRGVMKLIKLLEDKKHEVRSFMKGKWFKVSMKDPYTLIPLLRYYDSLKE